MSVSMEKPAESKLPIEPALKAWRGLSRYVVSIRFPGTSTPNSRLDIFDGIKKFGIFSIQNQRNHLYSLEFRSELPRSGLEEKFKELAGAPALFEYAIVEVPGG